MKTSLKTGFVERWRSISAHRHQISQIAPDGSGARLVPIMPHGSRACKSNWPRAKFFHRPPNFSGRARFANGYVAAPIKVLCAHLRAIVMRSLNLRGAGDSYWKVWGNGDENHRAAPALFDAFDE